MLVEVACDLCGGTNFELLYPSNIIDDELAPNHYYSSSRTIANYLDIVRCRDCHLVMSNPRDDLATLKEVYHRLEDRIYEGEESNRYKVARDHLKFASRFSSSPGKLLDIGSSSGIFLHEANRAGWQVTGIEPSQWAVNQSQIRCPVAEVHAVTLEEASFPKEMFNVVTLWDTLEHVGSPSQALRKVNSWLVPNGWLFLNVPDIASLPARFMGSRWVLLLREHLYYFSPETMRELLIKCGFEMVGMRPNYVSFSIENVLRRLGQYPGRMGDFAGRISRWEPLKRFSLKFPIGEINVAAQKK